LNLVDIVITLSVVGSALFMNMYCTSRIGSWRGWLVGFSLMAAAAVASAVAPINTGWFSDLTLKGYDPVAYFTDGKPVEGSADYTFKWNGATWHFASAAHRDLFAKEPAKYAPQYGGYCAWAMTRGEKADIDPTCWKIVDGKLYLNYSKDIQTQWSATIPDNISKANTEWQQLLDKDKSS
jgi:YHS domain-containing protein